jgi:hypothetical protein
VLRRSNLPVRGLAVTPDGDGSSRLTAAIVGEAPAVDRLIQQVRKVLGVRDARVSAAADVLVQEVKP